LRLDLGLRQGRQQQRGEDGDDGNNDQQFNDRIDVSPILNADCYQPPISTGKLMASRHCATSSTFSR
jgi:hypothetical protein